MADRDSNKEALDQVEKARNLSLSEAKNCSKKGPDAGQNVRQVETHPAIIAWFP